MRYSSLLVAAARCIYLKASILTIPRQSGERFASVNRILRCAVRNLGGSWARLRRGLLAHGTEEDFAASVRFEICAFEKTISRLYDALNTSGRMVLDHVLRDARDVVGAMGDEKYLMQFVKHAHGTIRSDAAADHASGNGSCHGLIGTEGI